MVVSSPVVEAGCSSRQSVTASEWLRRHWHALGDGAATGRDSGGGARQDGAGQVLLAETRPAALVIQLEMPGPASPARSASIGQATGSTVESRQLLPPACQCCHCTPGQSAAGRASARRVKSASPPNTEQSRRPQTANRGHCSGAVRSFHPSHHHMHCTTLTTFLAAHPS